jgi:hypothetical protein
MSKPFSIILMEAVVVGILLIIVYNIVNVILRLYKLGDKMGLLVLFVSGFIFHILCEITGINLWYVKDYNKYIVK